MTRSHWMHDVTRWCLLWPLALGAGAAGADSFTTGWLTLGNGWQTPYYIQEAAEPGPVVMIFGGVHGDEAAGAAAANDIRHWDVTRGTLIVVPSAAPQALAAKTRTIPGEGDLNRNFPGAGESSNATSGPTATALWEFVRQQSPNWFLDLHEGYDFRSSNPDSVGSSIIHANERVTSTYVDRMLASVNREITDPGKVFVSLIGPVDKSVARASVLHLGARGMILETTIKNQPLKLRVDQHRTMVSQFLGDQQMLSGPYGGDRGTIIDDFSFIEPDGMTLARVGNALPHGGVWSVSPFDSRVVDGRFRIQRNASGTSSTTTGMLGAGLIRVRPPTDSGRLATDIGEGFATMVVSGWDFPSEELGETIRFGFRSTASPDVFDTAQIVIQRTALNEVSVSGQGFGVGSGNIPAAALFGATQDVPVQFVLQLNKQVNRDGSPLVAGAAEGGFYRLFYQLPGREFVEIGSAAAVRQVRNGNFLNLQVAGPIGSSGGFFDIDRMTFSSEFPAVLLPDPLAGPVSIVVSSGRLSQLQAGYPIISSAESVTKLGAGTVVFDAANTYAGPTTISAGTLEVTHAEALGMSSVTIGAGATLAVIPGLTARSPGVTVAGGTVSAASLTIEATTGIASLAINAGTLVGSPLVRIASGGLMSLPEGSRMTVALGGLDVDQASGGRLDLGAGQVTIAAGGTTAAALRADIMAGRSGGSWSGGGIISTAAAASSGTRTVGYLLGADGVATVSFAAAGDTNLDGQVNVFDLVGIMSAARYGTGSAAIWSQGDFNYDGLTDVFDLVGIATSGTYGNGSYLSFGSPPTVSGGVAIVPEPASWGLVFIGLAVAGCGPLGRPSGPRRG
jgi:autotransporter-associated beta strand protein